jgi:hypothetical protein
MNRTFYDSRFFGAECFALSEGMKRGNNFTTDWHISIRSAPWSTAIFTKLNLPDVNSQEFDDLMEFAISDFPGIVREECGRIFNKNDRSLLLSFDSEEAAKIEKMESNYLDSLCRSNPSFSKVDIDYIIEIADSLTIEQRGLFCGFTISTALLSNRDVTKIFSTLTAKQKSLLLTLEPLFQKGLISEKTK